MESKVTKEMIETALGSKIKNFEILKTPVEYEISAENYEINVKLPDGDEKFLLLKVPLAPKMCDKVSESDSEEKSDEKKKKDEEIIACSGSMYWKELQVYSKFFPELEKLIEDKKNGLKLPIIPLVLGQGKSKVEGLLESFILLENIEKFGYRKSSDRILDYDHAALVTKSIAEIHALSWIYKKRNGLDSLTNKFDCFNEMLNTPEGRPMFLGMLTKSLEKLANTLEQNLGPKSPVLKAVKELTAEKLVDDVYTFTNPPVDGKKWNKLNDLLRVKTFNPEELANNEYYTVFSHSDIWQYNLLFHYDDKSGAPDRAVICEFLNTNEQSPMNDLGYFFYMSCDHKTRAKIPQLLQIYHERFLCIVKDHKTEAPEGFDDFKNFSRKFRVFKYFGFINGMVWFPLIFDKDEKKVGDVEEEKSMASFMKKWDNVECAQGRLACWLVELAKEMVNDEII